MSDLISVIVPVFNSERYVRQTLDSIVGQTYSNLEILVVDDGSTDASAAICDEFLCDPRVKVFHRQNVGLSLTRQFGIDSCTGAYFVTVDADDYVLPQYVEKLYAAIKTNDADIAVCGVSCFWENPESGIVVPGSVFMPSADDFMLTDSWNKMYRTQFVRDSGVKFCLGKIYNGTDLQFNHLLALHSPEYCVCPEALLMHRNHPGSRVQRKDKPMQEGFEIIYGSLLAECSSLGLDRREWLAEVYYNLMGIAVWDIIRLGGSFAEKHGRFRKLVRRNREFVVRHDIAGCRNFKVSGVAMPTFVLSSAATLDAAALWCRLVKKMKRI